jgi:hypothetical protein
MSQNEIDVLLEGLTDRERDVGLIPGYREHGQTRHDCNNKNSVSMVFDSITCSSISTTVCHEKKDISKLVKIRKITV